jgi:anion-transporting  ArsA/GET3 family ATPase
VTAIDRSPKPRQEVPVQHPFRDVRLHVVTGKGGTGKTTVAGALAIALAAQGRKVLLVEAEGRQGIAQLFDCPPLPYEERKIASAPGGGEVYALAIDPEEALLDYLEMFYNLKRAGRVLKRFGVVDFATTVAPGMRDVLITGKIKEAVVRTGSKGRQAYDAVVLDAPPTGRITRFLNVTSEVAGLAKMGPVKGQADSVVRIIRSPRTAVHIVTILEEMPVQETVDGVQELGAAQIPVGAVLVNMTRDPSLAEEDLDRAREGSLDLEDLAAGLKESGIDPVDDLPLLLAAEAADHANRVALETRERADLAEVGRPLYELPLLPEAIDLGGLYRLAEMLRAQGMTG